MSYFAGNYGTPEVRADPAPNVFTALAAAQVEFSAPRKESMNPAFRKKYADLRSVVDAVAPALSRHGLAFVHYADARDLGAGPEMCMVTALIHGSSGTRIECPVPLIVGKRDMQGFKSATTYAKRIGLESVTGVAPDDDDGAAAAEASKRAHEPSQPPPPPFDAAAAEKRIAAGIAAAATLDALRGAWMRETDAIGRLKAEAPDALARLTAAKDAAKAKLNQPALEGDEIPY